MNYEFLNKNGESFIFDGENMILFEKEKYDKEEACKLCLPIDDFRTKYFSHVALILNNICNLACEYCYANKGEFNQAGNIMTFEIAKDVIDKMFINAKKNKGQKIGICFFGGEPLLQFNLIKQIVKYVDLINEDNYRVAYSVITNGTLLTDEIVNFFVKYAFKVTISLDGTKEAHDRMRKFKDGTGSYDIIVHNMRKYREQIVFTCRLTVNDSNTHIVEAIQQIKELGIKRIVIGMDENISDESFNCFLKNYKELLEIYYEDIKKGDFYCIDNITTNLIRLVMRRRVSSHCNAGRAYFTISSDGKVYDCHRLVGKEIAFVCDTERGYEEKIDCYSKRRDMELKRDVGERIKSCEKCSFKYLCGGMCYHHAISANGKRFSKIEKDCKLVQFELKSMLNIITSLSLEKRREFILSILKS